MRQAQTDDFPDKSCEHRGQNHLGSLIHTFHRFCYAPLLRSSPCAKQGAPNSEEIAIRFSGAEGKRERVGARTPFMLISLILHECWVQRISLRFFIIIVTRRYTFRSLIKVKAHVLAPVIGNLLDVRATTAILCVTLQVESHAVVCGTRPARG